jgi:hypothetical protein
MVLQADSTTQSALSLSCATSLAVSSPSSSSDGAAGMLSASDGSRETLHVAGDETVGGEIDDSIIGKRRALQRGLAGVAAEMNIGRGNAEVFGHRIQFVGGIGQWRQGLCEPDTIDAGTAPEIGVGAGHHAAGGGPGRVAFVATGLRWIEQRIAEAGHRPGGLLLAGKYPQRFQACDRRQYRHRLTPEQPGRIAIALDFVRD